jgi:hypothetical protein
MYFNSKWKLSHAYLDNMRKASTMTTDRDLEEFLTAFDGLTMAALQVGFTPSSLAGAVLARVQHLYLADGSADIEGLVKLLQYSIDSLEARPKWNIE